MPDPKLVPPPPPIALAQAPPGPGVPEPNPFDQLFDGGQAAPAQEANPFDALFDQPAPEAAPALPLLKEAPKAQPSKPSPTVAPAPALKSPLKPKQTQVPPPPPNTPAVVPASPLQRASTEGAHAAGNAVHSMGDMLKHAAEQGAKGALDWISQSPIGKQIVDNARQNVAENEKHPKDFGSVTAAAATGVVHGGLKMAQDAYNATAGQLGHGTIGHGKGQRFDLPAAHFADDFKNLPGIKTLSSELPGHFDVGSTAGASGIPAHIPLPVGKLPAIVQHGLHGAAAGGVLGYAGSAGEQYKETGKVDQRQALQSAGESALVGGGLGIAGHIGTKAISKTVAGRGGKEIGEPKPDNPTQSVETKVEGKVIDTNEGPPAERLTPRKDRSYAPTQKTKLEQKQEEAKAKYDAAVEEARSMPMPESSGMPAPRGTGGSFAGVDLGREVPKTGNEGEIFGKGEPLDTSAEDAILNRYKQEQKLYPLHSEYFDGGAWRARDLTDQQISDLLDVKNSQTRKSNGYIPKNREIDALQQEQLRRKARIRDGHEVDWPQPEPTQAPEDLTHLTDDELAARDDQAAADEFLRRYPAPTATGQWEDMPGWIDPTPAQPEPLPEAASTGPEFAQPVPDPGADMLKNPEIFDTSAEPVESVDISPKWTLEKAGKGYKWTNSETGETRQRNVGKAEAERIVAGLNEGTIHSTKGIGDKAIISTGTTDHRQAIMRDGMPVSEEHAPIFQELAEAKHAYDEAIAKRSAAFDSLQEKAGIQPVMKSKPEPFYDRDVEKNLLETFPEQSTYEVQSSRKLTPEKMKFKSSDDMDQLATFNDFDKARLAAQDRYEKARQQAIRHLSENPELPDSITIPHEKGEVNIRSVPNRSAKQVAAKLAEHLESQGIKLGSVEEPNRSKQMWVDISRAIVNAYKPDGVSMSSLPGTKQILTAVSKLGPKIKNMDPRMLGAVLKNQLNSDIYEQHADPAFVHDYQTSMGKLDLAFQGVEKLKTAEQKHAWMANRYSEPSDILSGQNGTHLLDMDQRTALVEQNAILDDMADAAEQYAEHLKTQGAQPGLVGDGRLLRTLQSDLVQLDPRNYGGKDWLSKASSQLTHGLYGMTTLGNWQIHSLHAVEAGTVGASYAPKAFAQALSQIADPDVQKYVRSFESSSGIMKRVQETSPGGEISMKIQKSIFNKAGEMVGVEDASTKLAKNDKVQAAADVLEGSAAEVQKLHLMRAVSANKTAAEMGYAGGGKQLMKDMLDKNAMTPDDRLEAATKIVYHMNQMVGYTPHGVSDLNVFQRLANTTSPLFKLFTPFTTTRIQQSRVLTKFFSNAAIQAKSGNYTQAGQLVAQGMLMPMLIGLVGGRAAVPRDIQDLLHYAAPKEAKQFLEMVDHANIIGHALNKEIEHVTPQLFVPGYLGEGFPSQVAGAVSNIMQKEPGSNQHLRGIFVVAALFGATSIAERMGTGSLLKLKKAVDEGSAGKHVVWAGRLDNTLTSTVKSGENVARLGKGLGMPLEARNSGILGSTTVKTNILHEIYQKILHGESFEGAEFINKMRDDDAIGNLIHRHDEKLYNRLERARSKMSRSGVDVSDFWEKQLEEIEHQKHHEPEHKLAVEA